jgi:hypothetical protein
VVVAVGVIALLAAFYLLGTWGDEKPTRTTSPPTRGEAEATPTPVADGQGDAQPRRPRTVAVRIAATGPVYVCMEDARGRPVVDKATLAAGDATRTFRGRRFRVTFGTASARMRVNGRTYPVAASDQPVGYELRPGRKPRLLGEAQRPTCS